LVIQRSRDRSERGFTLIELLVVASILVVLAGIGLVQYKNGKTRASEAALKTDLFNLRDGIDQYYADKGMYPGTLDELVSSGYLRKVPDDPFTMSNSTWQITASEPDPTNPTAAPGVYDVKSGSDATALDGTKYADW
jgi:general secretion pathway protein G